MFVLCSYNAANLPFNFIQKRDLKTRYKREQRKERGDGGNTATGFTVAG